MPADTESMKELWLSPLNKARRLAHIILGIEGWGWFVKWKDLSGYLEIDENHPGNAGNCIYQNISLWYGEQERLSDSGHALCYERTIFPIGNASLLSPEVNPHRSF